MYDALKRGRDILTTAIEDDLPDILATTASAHSVTVSAPRGVYRAAEARPMYPNIEITPPRGNLTTLSKGAIGTTAEYWLIASVQSADPLWIDDALLAYLTALVRLTSDMDGDAYYCEPVEFDFSPPVFTDDTQQKRSVGVLVRMEFAESV